MAENGAEIHSKLNTPANIKNNDNGDGGDDMDGWVDGAGTGNIHQQLYNL